MASHKYFGVGNMKGVDIIYHGIKIMPVGKTYYVVYLRAMEDDISDDEEWDEEIFADLKGLEEQLAR